MTIELYSRSLMFWFCVFQGVLIGILFVKNIKWLRWESIVWWVALGITAALALFACLFNVFYVSYYPPTDWRPCCPMPDYFYLYFNRTRWRDNALYLKLIVWCLFHLCLRRLLCRLLPASCLCAFSFSRFEMGISPSSGRSVALLYAFVKVRRIL